MFMDNLKIKQFLLQLSSEAGDFLRNNFYTIKSVTERAGGGVATNIDFQLEAMLVRRISEAWPEHGIKVVGGSEHRPEAAQQWIVDPLDGSSHFSRNIPIFTTTIAWQENGEPIFAAVNQPQTRQLFFAEKGAGAYLNGLEISASKTEDLSQAFVYVELPEQKYQTQIKADQAQALAIANQLVGQVGQMENYRIGTYGQCLVASGAFDGYVDLSGSSLALAQVASTLILSEAGAVIIDLGPTPGEYRQVMAANPALLAKLKEVLVAQNKFFKN